MPFAAHIGVYVIDPLVIMDGLRMVNLWKHSEGQVSRQAKSDPVMHLSHLAAFPRSHRFCHEVVGDD